MGLLQKAVETYDCHQEYVGKTREGHTTLAPVSHMLTSAQIEITLDHEGQLIDARALDQQEPKIVIPVTEESAGRTSTPSPHPLCEQIGYLAPQNAKKYKLYLKQLEDWSTSEYGNPKLLPVLTYIRSGTIMEDLAARSILELDDNGCPRDEKQMVRWRVIEDGSQQNSECWMDRSLMNDFVLYYTAKKAKMAETICMITGDTAAAANQHPKGIIPIKGNAKLISSNDQNGFTYRGRFETDEQAVSISYTASQKAHNALRWLASEQGVQIGGRTFLSWNPQGHQVCSVTGPFCKHVKARTEPTAYQKDLQKALDGYTDKLPDNAGVVIAAFDAATTGRLSLTYYNELQGSDFLQRLYDWDLSNCWNNGPYGIQSPSILQIVNCAFGTQRENKNQTRLVTDDRVLRQQVQRLVACRVDRARIPTDLVKVLVQRASNPQAYDMRIWREIVFTACAVMNKYKSDRKGVDTMAWTLDTMDRSFQFGRLLATMERVEQDYYQKIEEDRQTSAIKALSEFRQRPWNTYERLIRHLNQAYLPRVKLWQRNRFIKLKDEIILTISQFPENELNRPLEDIYLMGYDLQHASFYQSKKDRSENNEEDSK